MTEVQGAASQVPGVRPDYQGGGLVNLMNSIAAALGGEAEPAYPGLRDLDLGPMYKPLVLIVLDGLGYEFVMGQSKPGLLQRYTVARMTSVCPSTTASAVTTYMTGQAPQQHGLTGWFMYLRELGAVSAVLPFIPRHGGADFTKVGVDPGPLLGLRPFSRQLPVPVQHILPAYIADSPVSRAFRGTAESYPYRDLQGFVGLIERAVRSGRGPRFVYAYWSEFDAMAHNYGIESRDVQDHYRSLETSLSAMLARLGGSGARVLISADHGFMQCPPERAIFLADHPRLETLLQLPLCGEPRFAYCYLRPGVEDEFDACVAQLPGVAACVDSAELLRQGWFGLGEPHPQLARRIGDRVLVMDDGWQIKDSLFGQQPHRQLGLHGGTSSAEMYVPLVMFDT